MKASILLIAAALFGLTPVPASLAAPSGSATVQLTSASPAPNSVGVAPAQIILRFSKQLESGLNMISVISPQGEPVKTDPMRLGPTDKTSLSLPLTPSLKPGRYTVRWRAVALKGGRAQGAYEFTVQP